MMNEISVKSQQEVFVSRVLPSLFHSAPDEFIRYLSRDGTKFLRFYWEQAEKDEQTGARSSALGLNYDIRQPFPSTTVILITLPRPAGARSCFVAAVYRPLRRTLFTGVSDTTKVISLEMAGDRSSQPATQMVEWSRKLGSETLGPGPEPHLEEFYQAVCALIKP
jgi:hypothetical protein